jgi:hypothetical protein
MLFDDDRKEFPFLQELQIIHDIVERLKIKTPHFEFKIIITGLKIVG